jgi:predicted PurR-regulated permease PerM
MGPRLLAPTLTALGGVVVLVTLFFVMVYLLVDAPRLRQFIDFSTPARWHPHIDALLPKL